MSASPIAPADRVRPRFSAAEWFTLRRHPLPEYWDSIDALPPSLRDLADAALLPGEPVQGALVLPAEYMSRKMLLWEYVPERSLVFVKDAVLHVSAEGPGMPARTNRIDAQALLYLRSSILLLYGLLEFEADCGGQPTGLRLEYNTVIWQMLKAPLARFLAAAGPRPPVAASTDDLRAANEAALADVPYKFASGMRYYSLDAGEHLLAAVFQPAIWLKGPALIPRQVTPNTLFGLTDRKLALIEEKRARPWSRPVTSQGEYGWIFTYIPLDRVVEVSSTRVEGLTELTIALTWGGAREERMWRLEPAVAERWLEVWRAFGQGG